MSFKDAETGGKVREEFTLGISLQVRPPRRLGGTRQACHVRLQRTGMDVGWKSSAIRMTHRSASLALPRNQNDDTQKSAPGLSDLCAQGTSPNSGRSTLGLSFGGDLNIGDCPAALDGFVPSKDRFLQIAARKGVMVSNGYHGYYVDSDQWQDNSPAAEAIRALADKAKTPDQQQGERGGVSPPVNSARQREIKRMIDQLRNVDIEGFFPTPDAVIDMMLAAADMHDGQPVLEPSAGIGSICDRVKQALPVRPDAGFHEQARPFHVSRPPGRAEIPSRPGRFQNVPSIQQRPAGNQPRNTAGFHEQNVGPHASNRKPALRTPSPIQRSHSESQRPHPLTAHRSPVTDH